MANSKITALTETTTPLLTDILPIVTDPAGTPVTKKVTTANILALIASGWTPASNTWTYASADAPTFTFTVNADVTGIYSPGMRIKLTQTTVKYFIITAVSAYSAPNTTITVYGGTDYTLTNAAITLPHYSGIKSPFGFPLDPIKWTQIYTNGSLQTQNTPVQNTWYNLGSPLLSIPIGAWRVTYSVCITAADASSGQYFLQTTLSTANNSESDVDFSTRIAAQSVVLINDTLYREKYLTLTSKTAYYLNTRTTGSLLDAFYLNNDLSTLRIVAQCAYL
jgi:hypothetical protein